MERHIIYSHTLRGNKEYLHKEQISRNDGNINTVIDNHNMSGVVSDILTVLFIVSSLYLFMRHKVTKMAMTGSDSYVWKSLHIFIMAIPLSILLSGVTLGAMVSRYILKRHITVDWYSVILGSVSIVIISYIHIINYLVIIPLSIITLASIIYIYIEKSE